MTKCSYKYGEIIIKENEIPSKMFMIMSGECKVMLSSIGKRPLPKDNLEYDFLSQINFMNRNYQNARIRIDENGAPVKNEI